MSAGNSQVVQPKIIIVMREGRRGVGEGRGASVVKYGTGSFREVDGTPTPNWVRKSRLTLMPHTCHRVRKVYRSHMRQRPQHVHKWLGLHCGYSWGWGGFSCGAQGCSGLSSHCHHGKDHVGRLTDLSRCAAPRGAGGGCWVLEAVQHGRRSQSS